MIGHNKRTTQTDISGDALKSTLIARPSLFFKIVFFVSTATLPLWAGDIDRVTNEVASEVGDSAAIGDRGLFNANDPTSRCRLVGFKNERLNGKNESQLKQSIFENDPDSGSIRPFYYYFVESKKANNLEANGKNSPKTQCPSSSFPQVIETVPVKVEGCILKEACLSKVDVLKNDLEDITCTENPRRVQSLRLRKSRLPRFLSGMMSTDSVSVVFEYSSTTDASPAKVQFTEQHPKSLKAIEIITDEDEDDAEMPVGIPRVVLMGLERGKLIVKDAGSLPLNLQDIKLNARNLPPKKQMRDALISLGIDFETYNRICLEKIEKSVLVNLPKTNTKGKPGNPEYMFSSGR